MNIPTVFSTMTLLTAFALCASKRASSYISLFKLQSFVLSLAAMFLAFSRIGNNGFLDLLILAVLIFILKVIYIPRLLSKTLSNVEHIVEKDFFLNIPILVLVSSAIAIFSYFVTAPFSSSALSGHGQSLANSIAVSLIGLFFMITRKRAVGMIVGFLIIENGLFSAALFATGGMPFIVDLGIFVDLITAVMVMGLLVFRINEKFESIDINKLRRLRG